MKKWGIVLAALFLLPAVIFLPKNGRALYNYAAKEGTRCSTCHVNPTGGMLRTQTGIDYAQNHHSFGETEESETGLNFFMGDNLQAGSDMRFMYIYQDSMANPFFSSRSTFFTMQGAIYLAAYLGPNLVLFYNNDFGYASIGQNRELWGMIRKLPIHGYVKMGRFKLPYGIRLDDHSSYIKDSLGFGLHSQDNGVEVGFTPATFNAHLALTNGKEHHDPFDDNSWKAFTGSTGFIVKNLSLGGSYHFNRRRQFDLAFNTRSIESQRAGVFGSISWDKFTFLGEIDYGWDDLVSDSLPAQDADNLVGDHLAGYAEGSYQIQRSIWLRTKFDFFDPRRGTKDDDIQRVTLGGDLYFYRFGELKLLYRINIEETKERNNEFLSQVHIFF